MVKGNGKRKVPRFLFLERGWPVKILSIKIWERHFCGCGQEMAHRKPTVIGDECVSTRYEFRWNHGQVLFALSPNKAQGVFYFLSQNQTKKEILT